MTQVLEVKSLESESDGFIKKSSKTGENELSI